MLNIACALLKNAIERFWQGSSSNSSGDESDGGDVGAEAESGTNEEEEPAENRDDPDRCVFCLENLPAVSRGIIPCVSLETELRL